MEKRWFRTSNATRKYKIGNHGFEFDKLSYSSGSWSGVLEVTDSQGDQLASYGSPVVEISEEVYLNLKKKKLMQSQHIGQGISPVPLNTKEMQNSSQEQVVVEDLEAEMGYSDANIEDSLEQASA